MLKIFFFSCFLLEYKLVKLDTTKDFQGLTSCRTVCKDIGMVPMPLDSDNDKRAIIELADYDYNSIVITGAIEIVDTFGFSLFFSKPGGKRVDFIRYSRYSTAGRWQLIRPRTYSVIIYLSQYFNEDYFSNLSFKHKDIFCACKLPGE